jgi:hypothetical protein
MNDTLIAGLISDNEKAIAAFGESDNCVVVDWRDGAAEIFDAMIPFLPSGYLRIDNRSSTEWAVQAGDRPECMVVFAPGTKHEDFFVSLNQVLAPDYELWQYTPFIGDAYSLLLAPSAWWQAFSYEHPRVLAKYFLSANRLAAYMRKSYFARLFSKP